MGEEPVQGKKIYKYICSFSVAEFADLKTIADT